MPIPTFEELLRPVLELADREPITRRTAADAMADAFELTDDEREERIPSGGSTYIRNRTGWAMTFLTKAGLIDKCAKFTYRASDRGRQFLAAHPDEITVNHLKAIPGWEGAWEAGKRRRRAAQGVGEAGGPGGVDDSDATPEELIGEAVETLDQTLRADLLEQLSEIDPFRFEQVVVDLLFAMGYGGSRAEAARVTKKSNDEGIDGVINEDRLGLDVIYVQAKRWKNAVGRPEIQSFVGALAGKQASKGVFITTGGFAVGAVEYAASVAQKVILIDGARLAGLMVEHNVGVSTVRTIAIKRVDSDYFEEG